MNWIYVLAGVVIVNVIWHIGNWIYDLILLWNWSDDNGPY